MTDNEFMYRMMTMMRESEKPIAEKHYGFGLPKHYRVIDTETGITVTAVEHKEVADAIATEKSEQSGHRFVARGMWM